MTSFSELLSIFALAFVLGALLPFAVRPILHRNNMVDVPNERSSHTAPTYRGMGLATAAATFVAFVAATLFGWTYRSAESLQLAVTIAAAILCALALGWLEDIRGVSIVRRAGLQLVIGVLVSVSFATVQGTNILLLILGAIFIAGYINVANFMDGINGISGAHGLVAGLAYALTGWIVNLPWLALAGVAVAGAFAAFLPWNVRPGKNVFLGDAGSYVLGAALGTLAVGAWFADVPFLLAFAPLMTYLADAGTTLFRRFMAGEQWYKPHRTHTYQRLTDVGFSHLGSTAVVTGTTILVWVLLAFASDLYAAGSVVATVGVVLVALAVLVVYLRMPQLFGGEAPTSTIDLSKRFAADSKGAAPKAKSATSEPATGSLTSATGVPATPENVEPTSLHPEPIMPESVKDRAGQPSSASSSSTQSNQNRGEKH
ncbi:MraY family glycosyltransferase [Rothia mucilaginosa]|uniref:MraY family glycosyltransferase n=1 Tax=Rothia mucilaginosa TaxID=43675 RepID=UPI001CB4BC40|nr:glycosyltransferase family 4 protein [Rothia mucilaginosa]MBF1641130.1 glycosyltransferase family 4 protein [Rothia mucilaginosa]UQF82438.1 MAG: glycosyltransferase family 4 protein [Rothia mucilaginosa]